MIVYPTAEDLALAKAVLSGSRGSLNPNPALTLTLNPNPNASPEP